MSGVGWPRPAIRERTERATRARFRPNIVFKGSGVPFAEDMWRRIVIRPGSGDPSEDVSGEELRTFTLVSKCARCLVRPSLLAYLTVANTCGELTWVWWISYRTSTPLAGRGMRLCHTRCY